LKLIIGILDVEVINVNADVARKYATLNLSLHKKGTKIPINAVWIFGHRPQRQGHNLALIVAFATGCEAPGL
jgi:hypothetical protein